MIASALSVGLATGFSILVIGVITEMWKAGRDAARLRKEIEDHRQGEARLEAFMDSITKRYGAPRS